MQGVHLRVDVLSIMLSKIHLQLAGGEGENTAAEGRLLSESLPQTGERRRFREVDHVEGNVEG